ncbi:hypothetical protein BOQ00_03825 [Campylobacter coli]|nr:hypothetical protein BOQ00_03825 [Campylobacter coli]
MIVNKTYEIDSCDDVELGIKRESKLEFKLCFDDEKEMKALVFIVPGLGGDANENYREHLAEFVANEFSVAVVSVNYHCIGNRPQTGSTFYLDDIDKLILQTSCETLGIKLLKDQGNINNNKEFLELCNFIDMQIQDLKLQEKLKTNYIFSINASLQPAKNEYQNFGVMQAQDLLNVALYLKAHAPFNIMSKNIPVVIIGSSHGGYLAHLAAKFAPWLVDGVIDNSSYAKFLWRLVGFGKEVDFVKYCSTADIISKNLSIRLCDKTFWTINKESKNFFSSSRRMIRYILEPNHIGIQANYPKPYYVSYHSFYDKEIAPPDEKIELYKYLKELNFDAKLNIIKEVSQIDGKFIKNLKHGMGMSIKLLIKKELPIMLEKIFKNQKQDSLKSISYPCEDLLYIFNEVEDKICLEIRKI